MRKVMTFLAGLVLAGSAVQAEIVYQNLKDNPSEPETSYEGRLEFGDQITLAGTERWITGFSFEYFADFEPTGDETARLRFYANDGGYGENDSPMPGTLLLDTGEFTLQSGYKTARLDGLAFEVPDSFTWTIEFSGLAEAERAGLLIDENVNVGASAQSYWERREESWREVELPGLSANYIAQVSAVEAPLEIIPGSIQVQGGVAVLEVDSVPGRFYTLEYITTVGGSWQPASGAAVQAASDKVVLEDHGAGESARRFYRVAETLTAG